MAAELDYRKVIRKSYSKLIEDLDPQPILDQFIEKDFLPATTIRDIQELRSTSEKNRAIVDRVLTKGLNGYRNFKKFLRNAHQGFLAESLGKMEKKVQDNQKLKPSFGNRDMNSELTQPHGAGDGGPVTINRGGEQSMNIYGGKVEITGNVNFGGGPMLPHPYFQSGNQHVSSVPNSGYFAAQETQLPGQFPQLSVNQPVGQVTGQTGQGYGQTGMGNVLGNPQYHSQQHVPGTYNQLLPGQLQVPDTYNQFPYQHHAQGNYNQVPYQQNVSGIFNQFQPQQHAQGNVNQGASQLNNSNPFLTQPHVPVPYQQPIHNDGRPLPPSQPPIQEDKTAYKFPIDRAKTPPGHFASPDLFYANIKHTQPQGDGPFSPAPADQTQDIPSDSEQPISQPQESAYSNSVSQKEETKPVSNSPVDFTKEKETDQRYHPTGDPHNVDKLTNQVCSTYITNENRNKNHGEKDKEDKDTVDAKVVHHDLKVALELAQLDPKKLMEKDESEKPKQQNRLKGTTYLKVIHKDVDDGRIQMVDVDWIEDQIENYSIKLAQGSTADVFLLNDAIPQWGFEVVVKKIKCEEYKERPVRNEIVAARLRHHATIPLLAKGKRDNFYYFLFPYMKEGELMNAIARDMNEDKIHMNATTRVSILYQIACAMLFIHTPVDGLRNQMFHGDITSRNIVLDGNYKPRLLDFGIARELKIGEDAIKSKTGDQIGTYGYTTVTKMKELSTKTDCKNFGVLILEMLTGSAPIYDGEQLQKIPLKSEKLKQKFHKAFKKVWEDVENEYKSLITLAKKCLNKEIESRTITTELYDILSKLNYEWKTEALGEDGKCSLCMLNPVAKGKNLKLKNCLDNVSHVSPPVCVACMRNSYLNPIQCLRCRKTIPTKIGNNLAAILILGYDNEEDYRKAIANDVKEMKNILTSKYPLIFGLSDNRVITTTLRQLRRDISKLDVSTKSFLVYYSGHHDRLKGFQVDEDCFFTKKDFQDCLSAITKDIILIMDCCYPLHFDKKEIPKLKLQLNASRVKEKASFTKQNSLFTRLFIQSLGGKLNDSCLHHFCSECEDYRKKESTAGFISLGSLFENIHSHMKKENTENCRSTPTMNVYVKDPMDLLFAYKHEAVDIQFFHEGSDDQICEISKLDSEEELKTELLKYVLKDRYKGFVFENHGDKWKTYIDAIAITTRKGPHEADEQELNGVKQVAQAWNQKLELFFGIRKVKNIHNSKVGVFFNDPNIKTHDILEKYLKSDHFKSEIVKAENQTTVIIPWKKEIDDETHEQLQKLKPTNAQPEEAAYMWFCEILDIESNQKIKELTHIVFTVPSGIWENGENDFLTIHLEGVVLDNE